MDNCIKWVQFYADISVSLLFFPCRFIVEWRDGRDIKAKDLRNKETTLQKFEFHLFLSITE